MNLKLKNLLFLKHTNHSTVVVHKKNNNKKSIPIHNCAECTSRITQSTIEQKKILSRHKYNATMQ